MLELLLVHSQDSAKRLLSCGGLVGPVDARPLPPEGSQSSFPQTGSFPFLSLMRAAVLNLGQFCTPGDIFSCQTQGENATGV